MKPTPNAENFGQQRARSDWVFGYSASSQGKSETALSPAGVLCRAGASREAGEHPCLLLDLSNPRRAFVLPLPTVCAMLHDSSSSVVLEGLY